MDSSESPFQHSDDSVIKSLNNFRSYSLLCRLKDVLSDLYRGVFSPIQFFRDRNEKQRAEDDESRIIEYSPYRWNFFGFPPQIGYLLRSKDHTRNQWLVLREDGTEGTVFPMQINFMCKWIELDDPQHILKKIRTFNDDCHILVGNSVSQLSVAWIFLAGVIQRKQNKRARRHLLQLEYDLDVFQSLHNFLFPDGKSHAEYATFLLMKEVNPFFETKTLGYGRVSCVLKTKSIEELDIVSMQRVRAWVSHFQRALEKVRRNGSIRPLHAFLGAEMYDCLESELKHLAHKMERTTSFHDVEVKSWNCTSTRGYFLAAAVVGYLTGHDLYPSSAFDALVDMKIYDRHINIIGRMQFGSGAFPKELLDYADHVLSKPVSLDEVGDRTDFTNLISYAIDSADTVEVDDAISLGNEDGEVIVHIADVARLFSQKGREDPIFIEAMNRLSTWYLPERKVLMLPPQIVCETSLAQEKQEVCAVSLKFKMIWEGTGEGKVIPSSIAIYRSRIRPPIRLTYENVEEALMDENAKHHHDLLKLILVSQKLRKGRCGSQEAQKYRSHLTVSSAVVKTPEIRIKDQDRRSKSDVLVSEITIATNVAAARFGKENGLLLPYRSTKCGRAILKTEAGSHDGLRVPQYVQMTSPIRRFWDLLCQFQICDYLQSVSRKDMRPFVERACKKLSEYEKRMGVVRYSEEYWFCELIRRRGPNCILRGRVFRRKYSVRIQLMDFGFDIPAREASKYRLGTELELKVTYVYPRARYIRFEILKAHKDRNPYYP